MIGMLSIIDPCILPQSAETGDDAWVNDRHAFYLDVTSAMLRLHIVHSASLGSVVDCGCNQRGSGRCHTPPRNSDSTCHCVGHCDGFVFVIKVSSAATAGASTCCSQRYPFHDCTTLASSSTRSSPDLC